jgi:hypothetical protein
MARSQRDTYGSFVVHVIALWRRTCSDIEVAVTPEQYQAAFDRFSFLRHTVAAWPVEALELRHKQALLVLLEDTVRWAETRHAGGDVEASERDLQESITCVYAEVLRLAAARRDRSGTAPSSGSA